MAQAQKDPRRHAPGEDRYVVISGHGRSGSNYLLDILDCHEATICRNEPHGLSRGVMGRLPDSFFPDGLPDDFPETWREARRAAALRFGGRDRMDHEGKIYHSPRTLGRIHEAAMRHKFFRRIITSLSHKDSKQEWCAPGTYIDSQKLRQALPVFKMPLSQGWVLRTHATDPGQLVVHIIRNPEGFLKSWYNRYVLKVPGHGERVFRDNLESVGRILAWFGETSREYRDFSLEALLETELWRWRYVNEVLFDTLSDSERYLAVRYSDLRKDPARIARRVYDFTGLGFTDTHKECINGMQNTLFSQPHTTALDDRQVAEAVASVLGQGKLANFLAA